MNEKEVIKALETVLAFFTLDPQKMKASDQFYYISLMLKLSDMVEPLVKEYGGSVEELQKKFEKQQGEQQFKDIASAILLKAMMDQKNKETEEDDKEDE